MRDDPALELVPLVASQQANLNKQILKWLGESIVPIWGLNGVDVELKVSALPKWAAARRFSRKSRVQWLPRIVFWDRGRYPLRTSCTSGTGQVCCNSGLTSAGEELEDLFTGHLREGLEI